MRKELFVGVLLFPVLALAAGEEGVTKAYRWVDKNGSVHFSSTPPAGVKATEIELPPPQVVVPQESRPQLLEQGRSAGEWADSRQQERDQVLTQIEALKEELNRAIEAYNQGEVPQPGERQHLRGGGSRLNESYQQRRESESTRIEQLQLQLEGLYEKLHTLR